MAAQLQITLLGSLKITRDGIPVADFISSKVPALLAYLAVTRRAHTREKLAALLWGEMPEADARNNLRQSLTNLRKLVDDHLIITRDSVEFDGECLLDTAQFEHSVRAASPESLTAALGLYRGDFLDGFLVRDAPDFEDWLLTERARLREMVLSVLHALTEFHTAEGRYSTAIGCAARLLAFDPWREEAHRQLMLLQARTGQWSAALAQYESCRRTLEKELGVEPAAETILLYERIRAARQGLRHNLPAETTVFIGRAGELESLRRRLADPTCRLVTLTGLGGVGKTRLALHLAALNTEIFLNGVWFVPLAALQPEGLVPAIAEAVQFSFSSGEHKKQLFNFLRQKEMLIVLDNFEHLLSSSPFLTEILRAAPAVKLLVTSRERLDIEGEWTMEISGLEVPLTSSAVDSFSAAQLFLQGAARAGGNLAEPDFAAVADICRMVGGLPLGLEIAAAWTRSMRPAVIADEIRRGLDFLASTRRDLPERQRSLRVIFESTWGRLTGAGQRTLARLAVFSGGFTMEAAGKVTGASASVFAELTDKALVQQTAERFELHEVIRQFALEKLTAEPDLLADARGDHARYFADLARNLSLRSERQTFPVMQRELENMRAAWAWAAGQVDVAVLANLAPFTKRYLDVQGRYREGIELFNAALERLGAPASPESLSFDERGRLIARLLAYKGLLMADAGEPEKSRTVLETCLAYFRRAGDGEQIAVCLNGLGNASRFVGQEREAAVFYREELTLARSLNNRQEETTALNNLALVFNSLGELAEAERMHRECLALRREMGDSLGVSSSLVNLGVVLFDQRRFAEAKTCLAESIEISRQLNQARQLAASLGNLGGILVEEGRYDAALQLFLQGLEIHRNTGYRFGTAIALDNVGTAYFHLGNKREALYYLRQSIREAGEIRADFVILDALVWVAGLFAQHGNRERAMELLSMIVAHPKVDLETVGNAKKEILQVAKALSPEIVTMAQNRGQQLALAEVVDSILTTGLG
jgi:DNA-binding SARP family transcriptional activator/predicted ATPase/Tfp pilus assembly protein PilF